MSWTDERVDKLRELWGNGKSASEIADLLGGVSRNAVIGKAHRLGLSGRPSPIRKREDGAPTPTSRVAAAAPAPTTPPAKPAAPAKPTVVADRDAGPGDDGATILNLTERMCRWPIGDPKKPGFRFCGRSAIAGLPYCQDHATVAYQAPSSKKSESEKQTA
ncbi:MAG: GcrA family cell cycle regulator [Azospirillaceae bacterium]